MSASITPARTGIANLPLHYGKVPPWLFDRMVKLARHPFEEKIGDAQDVFLSLMPK